MYQQLLRDATFFGFLDSIDRDLAAGVRAAGCVSCGGALHSAAYPRKPRGGPVELPRTFEHRLSFCCAIDGCRRRATPPSVRFLGRRVYLAAVVVLVSAMLHGASASRVAQLRALTGATRRTIIRWRSWWRTAFPRTAFWAAARSGFRLPPDTARLPASLLEAFAGELDLRVQAALRFLSPLSTPSAGAPVV